VKKVLLILFFVFGAGELLSIITQTPALHVASKPVLMLILAMYYWFAIRVDDRSWMVVFALLSSGIGDILLMVAEKNEEYFLPGLGAFLMAHVCYIFSYRQYRIEAEQNGLHGIHRARLAFPIVLAVSGLIIVLYPSLGSMRVPVIIYALVILMMVLQALFRYGRTKYASFLMVMAGALLFMASDALIAINKFLKPLPQASLWIMALYIGAQFLIIQGLIRHQWARK
jgi:uncharacterized membrane protein YhhN